MFSLNPIIQYKLMRWLCKTNDCHIKCINKYKLGNICGNSVPMDLQYCKMTQVIVLILILMLYYHMQHNPHQNSLHVSSNVS